MKDNVAREKISDLRWEIKQSDIRQSSIVDDASQLKSRIEMLDNCLYQLLTILGYETKEQPAAPRRVVVVKKEAGKQE